jgi:prepilin-type N-terminal cleavage/methylation domain-containing protein
MNRDAGWTLVEVMVVLAVVGILVGVCVPRVVGNFSPEQKERKALDQAAKELYTVLVSARSEAAASNCNVAVLFTLGEELVESSEWFVVLKEERRPPSAWPPVPSTPERWRYWYRPVEGELGRIQELEPGVDIFPSHGCLCKLPLYDPEIGSDERGRGVVFTSSGALILDDAGAAERQTIRLKGATEERVLSVFCQTGNVRIERNRDEGR